LRLQFFRSARVNVTPDRSLPFKILEVFFDARIGLVYILPTLFALWLNVHFCASEFLGQNSDSHYRVNFPQTQLLVLLVHIQSRLKQLWKQNEIRLFSFGARLLVLRFQVGQLPLELRDLQTQEYFLAFGALVDLPRDKCVERRNERGEDTHKDSDELL